MAAVATLLPVSDPGGKVLSQRVFLRADPRETENNSQWSQSAPNAGLNIDVTNQQNADFFTDGKLYRVTIEPADLAPADLDAPAEQPAQPQTAPDSAPTQQEPASGASVARPAVSALGAALRPATPSPASPAANEAASAGL